MSNNAAKTDDSSMTDADDKTKDDNTHPKHYLMWFRRDLRIHDNTALTALCERVQSITNSEDVRLSAVYFCTPEQWQEHDNSVAQVDHIMRTLPILAQGLQQLNIPLTVYVCANFANSIQAIDELCANQNIGCVMANHEYEGNEIDRDEALTTQLAKNDIEFVRWHDQCILPPLSITTNDGDSMYKVFTPFYKKWRDTLEASQVQNHNAEPINSNAAKVSAKPIALDSITASAHNADDITSLGNKLLDNYKQSMQKKNALKYSNVDAQLEQSREDYPAGETAACQRLQDFTADDINTYNVSRDKPILQGTSHMSAYLTIGSISPRRCYIEAVKAQDKLNSNGDVENGDNENINRWISELAWRDFYRHVLVNKPRLVRHHAYKEAVDKKVNWSYDEEDFAAWCKGLTGVPLVDAAMRCLNATGFMHNRLRMVTAMFLTKDLLIDWRWGERYFMQQLVDGDFSSNNGGWQWSASTGTDSSPYFRIMNPFSQGSSHDPKAQFIKTWLPELKDVPASILHSEEKLRKQLSKGGKFADIDYPQPIVKHKDARLAAIAEFKK